MAHLIEYRKVNNTHIPLYFKFATISTKHNLTSDKYMSLENWMYIFDQLDEILAGEASSSKKSKIFDADNKRLTVKAKWMRTSDLSSMGNQILKILNLNSSSGSVNVGKHFLKIDIKLNSNFERLLTDLEQQNKILEEKQKITEANHEAPSSVKQENCDGVNSSEMLPKEEGDKNSLLQFQNTTDYMGYEDAHFEEYVPIAMPTPFSSESPPTYNPSKNSTQTEINQIQSEYSPTFLNANKSVDDGGVSYRPSTRYSRSVENDTAKKSKKSRIRGTSKELFGTSTSEEEEEDGYGDVVVSSSSSQHKLKRKKETPLKKETKSVSKSKKKKVSDPRCSQESVTDVGDISLRNLMNDSIDDILGTFPEHEEHLKELYDKHITELKRHYRPKDIPDLVAHDLVTPEQFKAMVDFLEKKLVRNLEQEHNYSDVIFDAILPEWAFEIFCRKFQYSRSDALETLHMQSIALSNRSDSQLM